MSNVWDLKNLQLNLSQGHVKSCYTIMGEDSYILQESLSVIKDYYIQQGLNLDFNFDCLYTTEKKISDIVDIIETLPMMAPTRLVLIKDIHVFKDKDWEILKSTIDKGLNQTVLVLVHEAKFDKRKKIYKWLLSETQIVEVNPPYENQIPQWIHYMGQKNGLIFDQGAVLQLLNLVGSDLMEINHEILKLKNYFNDHQGKLYIDDILKVVSKKRIENIFDLTAAVAHGKNAEALQLLKNILDQGQNEVGVISLMARHMRILKKILDYSGHGLSQKQLSTKVGVSPFFMDQYLAQSKKWTVSKMQMVFDLILETDKALKSSPVSSKVWLENFILQTCRLEN